MSGISKYCLHLASASLTLYLSYGASLVCASDLLLLLEPQSEGRGRYRLSCTKGLDSCPAAGTLSCPPCLGQHALPHERTRDHLGRSGVLITRHFRLFIFAVHRRIVLPALRFVPSLQGDHFQNQNVAHHALSSCWGNQ